MYVLRVSKAPRRDNETSFIFYFPLSSHTNQPNGLAENWETDTHTTRLIEVSNQWIKASRFDFVKLIWATPIVVKESKYIRVLLKQEV